MNAQQAQAVDISELLKKPYLNEQEVELLTGIKLWTLRHHRQNRRGIPYLKVGMRAIRYKTADVVAYMESTRISFDA